MFFTNKCLTCRRGIKNYIPINEVHNHISELAIGLATCDMCGHVNKNIDSWSMRPFVKDMGWWRYEPRILIMYRCQNCNRLRKKLTGTDVIEKISELGNHKNRFFSAEEMNEQIKAPYKTKLPSLVTYKRAEGETESPATTIKTESLHIEENRCPYCYKKFDERTLKLRIKGYSVHCPTCDHPL